MLRQIKSLFDRLPFAESLRAFLEQWGLWPIVSAVGGGMMATLIAVWAWLESHLPYWAIAGVFLVSLAVILAGTNYALGIHLKRKQARLLDRIVTIDRDGLANELEDLSRKIAGLVGEYRGPLQEAWWTEAARKNPDPHAMQISHAKVEGQLVEKFSFRHGSDVWRLIRRASKVVPIDSRELWRFQHGSRGEHDLIEIYRFLAQLADDVRNPKEPLPDPSRPPPKLIEKS